MTATDRPCNHHRLRIKAPEPGSAVAAFVCESCGHHAFGRCSFRRSPDGGAELHIDANAALKALRVPSATVSIEDDHVDGVRAYFQAALEDGEIDHLAVTHVDGELQMEAVNSPFELNEAERASFRSGAPLGQTPGKLETTVKQAADEHAAYVRTYIAEAERRRVRDEFDLDNAEPVVPTIVDMGDRLDIARTHVDAHLEAHKDVEKLAPAEAAFSSLEPCPFCGAQPEVKHGVGESWVLCPACKASAGMANTPFGAVTAWNARFVSTNSAWRMAADYWTRKANEAQAELRRLKSGIDENVEMALDAAEAHDEAQRLRVEVKQLRARTVQGLLEHIDEVRDPSGAIHVPRADWEAYRSTFKALETLNDERFQLLQAIADMGCGAVAHDKRPCGICPPCRCAEELGRED